MDALVKKKISTEVYFERYAEGAKEDLSVWKAKALFDFVVNDRSPKDVAKILPRFLDYNKIHGALNVLLGRFLGGACT